MRQIQINFTIPQTSVGNIGYVGEHNQTELVITPPTDLSGDENVTAYRIAFGVGESKIYSETYPKADTISCLLWQQVTADNTLGIQLEGYDDNGDLIAKSAVVYGFLSPSVDGEDETAEFTDPVIADITANTLARHTHSNKAILDNIVAPPAVEISDTAISSLYTPTELRDLVFDNAVLFYQDIPIVYYQAGTVFDFAYFSSENDTLIMRYKRVDTNKGISDTTNFEFAVPIEISTPTNASKSLWTPAELEEIWQARKPLTYGRLPIIARQYDSGANTFKFAYCFSSIPNKAITFCSVNTVNAGKSISSIATDNFTIPLTVNTKKANTSGAITVKAEDISATSGWTPSNDTDLATKKYVDDNAGGSGGEFIITITDVGGVATADKTESEIYQAWTDGLPIVIESADYRIPMITAKYENGEYQFYCVCADLDTTVITYYAYYTTNDGWELDLSGYVPPVTDVVDGNGDSVINNGVVTLADVAISNSYNDLDDKPTIPAAQIQSDWNEADNTALDYIKNKPATMPPSSHTHTKSDITDFPSLATVATSGSYNDLLNQPTIPDISGCEVTTNKVTSLSNTSTDTEYPSAKCVYDELGNKQNTLTAGTGISIVGDTISVTGGSIPSGTANGDLLVWDNDNSVWTTKPYWQITYQPVQYIESSGTQHIDTGVVITSDLKMVLEKANVNTNECIEGALWTSNNPKASFSWGNLSGGTTYKSLVGSDTSSWSDSGVTVDTNTHTFEIESGSQKIDGVQYATKTIADKEHAIGLFGWNANGSWTNYSSRLYSCKFYKNGVLIRDFVPCYNVFTGEVGLFDKAYSKFYGNAGTGTFTKGADV